MSNSTVGFDDGRVRPVRLKGGDLAFRAWRKVYLDLGTWAPFWALFTVIAAIRLWGWRTATHGTSDLPDFRLRLIFYAVLAGLAGGFASALTLRRLLGAQGDSATAISGAAVYTGLVASSEVVLTLFGTGAPNSQTVFGVLILAFYVATSVVFLRLVLWPVSKLMDDGLTLRGAWARTRGATIAYVSAVLRITLVPFIPYMACAALYYRRGDLGLLIAGAPLLGVVNVLGLAALAELYLARGSAHEDTAAVFD